MSAKCLTQQDLILLAACTVNYLVSWKVKKKKHITNAPLRFRQPVGLFVVLILKWLVYMLSDTLRLFRSGGWCRTRGVFLCRGLDKTAVMSLRARGSCVVSGSVPVMVFVQSLVGRYEITCLVSEMPHAAPLLVDLTAVLHSGPNIKYSCFVCFLAENVISPCRGETRAHDKMHTFTILLK